jgi:hypothetical protein
MGTQSLYDVLCIFLDWHPSRIKTFAELIWGVVKARTVKIKEIAMTVSSQGNVHAKIMKVERMFSKQVMDFVNIGQLIVKLISPEGKVQIAIDRTNWQFGSKNLNFFVATIICGSISVPIAWLLLDKKGNSNTAERKKLIEQIVKIMPKDRIEIILADREFVGEEWFKYLSNTEKIPFAIRIKKNEQIGYSNGDKIKLSKHFSGMQQGEIRTEETRLYKIPVRITCMQLERDKLIIASNVVVGNEALIKYKQRWGIERSFKSLKTSGFNIEDTHMTNQEKLKKLFAIVSLALAICMIAGEIKNHMKPIVVKNHGRKLYSVFTYGFDWLKDYFCNLKNQHLSILFELLLCRIIRVVQ